MKFYVLRSRDGKFFKSKGYGGYGNSWRDTLEEAKFYNKIGPAKAQVTYWFKNHPEYGCPELLVFEVDVANATVLHMESLTKQSIKDKQLAQARSSLRGWQCNLDYAVKELDRMQKKGLQSYTHYQIRSQENQVNEARRKVDLAHRRIVELTS